LQIHRSSDGVFPEQRPPLRRLHDVNREATLQHPLDGETGAVHGDALTPLDAFVGRSDGEGEAPSLFPLPSSPVAPEGAHPPHRGHNPGKHIRLSNTSNVSGPRARRSTGIQRGAAASGAAAIPGNAGTAASPSHTG